MQENGLELCLYLYSIAPNHNFAAGQAACRAESSGELFEFSNFNAEQSVVTTFLYENGGRLHAIIFSITISNCLKLLTGNRLRFSY